MEFATYQTNWTLEDQLLTEDDEVLQNYIDNPLTNVYVASFCRKELELRNTPPAVDANGYLRL